MADHSPAPEVDEDLPGFNALRANGCVSNVERLVNFEVEFWGWLPLGSVLDRAEVMVEGTVSSLSDPRITTLGAADLGALWSRVEDEVDAKIEGRQLDAVDGFSTSPETPARPSIELPDM